MEEVILSQSGLRTSQFKGASFIFDAEIKTAGSNLEKVTVNTVRKYNSTDETIGDFVGTMSFDNQFYTSTLKDLTADEASEAIKEFYEIVAGLTK